YEEAAALPSSPPKASVTTIAPSTKSNPYGVAPDEGIVAGPSAKPRSSTVKALMLFVPRSVTTSVRPSGLTEICAGSAASAAAAVRAQPRQPPVAGAVEGDALVPLGVVRLDVDAFVHCSALP